MDRWFGPFFVKNEKGEFELASMCKKCAFGDEKNCCLNPCTYLWAIAESEEQNND